VPVSNTKPQLYAVILSEALRSRRACPERSRRVRAKPTKGRPSLTIREHEYGCTRACPERSRRVSPLRPGIRTAPSNAVILSEVPSHTCCPDRARSTVEAPAVRLGWHEKGCPILSRTLRKGGNRNSISSRHPERSVAQPKEPARTKFVRSREQGDFSLRFYDRNSTCPRSRFPTAFVNTGRLLGTNPGDRPRNDIASDRPRRSFNKGPPSHQCRKGIFDGSTFTSG